MTELTEADRLEIEKLIREEKEQFGCTCPPDELDSEIEGGPNRAYTISMHLDGCPLIEHYSKPENEPEW